jgi:hypothetical protein
MSGAKGSGKALDAAKNQYRDLELQIEACTDALSQIRQRVKDSLPDYFRQKIASLEKQYEKASNSRNDLEMEWLECCAKAALLHEKLHGTGFVHLGSGEMRPETPRPGFKFQTLGDDKQAAFLELVRRLRAEGDSQESIHRKLDRITTELEKVEKILASGDFEAETDRILGGHNSVEPEPESEPAPRQTTEHTVDYDKLKVEY